MTKGAIKTNFCFTSKNCNAIVPRAQAWRYSAQPLGPRGRGPGVRRVEGGKVLCALEKRG